MHALTSSAASIHLLGRLVVRKGVKVNIQQALLQALLKEEVPLKSFSVWQSDWDGCWVEPILTWFAARFT